MASKKKVIGFRVDEQTMEKIQRFMKTEGIDTLQEFGCRALKFYTDYLSGTGDENFVTRTVDRAMQGRLAQFEDRHRRMDSKVAIALTEALLVMGLSYEFTPQELSRIRTRAVELVQKTGGPISAERAQIEADQLADDPFGRI